MGISGIGLTPLISRNRIQNKPPCAKEFLSNKQLPSLRKNVSFGFDPFTIVAGATAAYGAYGLGKNILIEGVKDAKLAYEKYQKWKNCARQQDIDKMAEENPQIPRAHLEKMYITNLQKTIINSHNSFDHKEVGLNKVMGYYDLKHVLSSKVLMPLCEIMEGNAEHENKVPNGINFFGTLGSGKTYIANALGEHYKEKGGRFEELKFTDNDDADIANLKQKFAEAAANFKKSEYKQYTMFLIDDIDEKTTPKNAARTAELMKLVNSCKYKGIILITTTNKIHDVHPALLQEDSTDLIIPIRGVEGFELADTLKYYLTSSGMHNNIKEDEYKGIIDSLSKDQKFVFKPKEIENALQKVYNEVSDHGGYLTADHIKKALMTADICFTKENFQQFKADRDYAKEKFGTVYENINIPT
ncbi:MAG: ATP-binding protein [Candidatus Gastranaerophilaceae bacterium]|jgi:DNA replication protein DnaC